MRMEPGETLGKLRALTSSRSAWPEKESGRRNSPDSMSRELLSRRRPSTPPSTDASSARSSSRMRTEGSAGWTRASAGPRALQITRLSHCGILTGHFTRCLTSSGRMSAPTSPPQCWSIMTGASRKCCRSGRSTAMRPGA